VLLTKYGLGEQIEKNEMGGRCSTYVGEDQEYIGFWWGNLRERDHSEDPGVDGWIILRWIFRKWHIDWTDLTQGMDRWRALVNAVMNLRFA
jgi:hypothetical protein